MSIVKTLIGDTLKFTYISSGDTFNPIWLEVRDGEETLIGSATMSSSGNGHYYHNYTFPDTPGYYVGKMIGYVNSLSYPRAKMVRLVTEEVD